MNSIAHKFNHDLKNLMRQYEEFMIEESRGLSVYECLGYATINMSVKLPITVDIQPEVKQLEFEF